MNNKKPVIIILIISLGFILLFLSSQFMGNQLMAKSYIADVYIDEFGDITVKEKLTMKYPEGYHVIFRDIIYDKNINNSYHGPNQSSLDFDSLKVRVRNSHNELIFDSENKPNKNVEVGYSHLNDLDEEGQIITCPPNIATDKCESIFIHVKTGMESQMTFEYDYKIIGALTQYNDITELNWRLLDYFDRKVQSSVVTLHLPQSVHSRDDFHLFGHGLYNGSIEIVSNTTMVLDIKTMKQGDFIEFRLLLPKDITPLISLKNKIDISAYERILAEEAKMAKEANVLRGAYFSLLIGAALMGLAMIMLVIYIYRKYDREFIPAYDGKYYRDLPAEYTPAEMSYLYYFKKINDEDVTATLLDLIRKKYLILENAQEINARKPDFVLKLNPEAGLDNLKLHERHLINWFINHIGDGKKVSLQEVESYPKANVNQARRFNEDAKMFVDKASVEGRKNDFFDLELERIRPRLAGYVVFPIIYIIISFLVGAVLGLNTILFILIGIFVTVVYLIYIYSFKRRSVNGNNDYAKWKAFKTFLLEFSQIKDYPIPGVVVWEHYLVYATSLKIADKVMDQLKVKLPINESTSPGATFMAYNHSYPNFYYGYLLGRISSSFSTAKTNSFQTISAHNMSNFSSKGGRGGGFSGGSSFGGGGGGFRSR